MKEPGVKQVVFLAGIALAFIATLVGGVAIFNKAKPVTATPSPNGDMASMHAPPPAADDAKFKSLLGNPAPEFNLQSYNGKNFDLASFKGKNVVLFFSEGAMCYPSCWDQVNEFTKDIKKFDDKNAVVVTVVVDSKSDWSEAVKKDSKLASATVLLDVDKKVSQSYGVLTVDSSMHRGQFPGHTYVIIDKEGVVRYEYDDSQMGIRNYELLSELNKII
ncbi:MAG: Alkyl hydroperoxide reductase/ Thiol specific antioxidant/ Mal allergen [Candidatus Woesebacteria bacterium GW2011_GWB1_45_5]|uniref:Alkyl hydroperoxide reductase/ Thiol specific antioxidant/ Mal allergen n=1 Tax=Candidatus Woesebacteria bacterium GW2011_GWB1_45_5 TaxID=1618581 RepID=A0A0G1MP60_9BACT|nr:MAG: Alkyl hydroperoxide reductase/ Thiol specific antioxidant/ Mal allergen [Candidatus Woesebacteria bacterium GW2011_GWB1_45_5]